MSFVGSQRIMTSPVGQGITSLPLDRLAWYKSDYVYTMRVLYDGEWRDIDLEMSDNPVSSKFVIKTVNHKSIAVTPDHIQLTQRGQVKTSELTTDDFIQMNISVDSSSSFAEDDAAYQTGFTIGACFAIGDESSIESDESEADDEELKYGVTTKIDYIEFTKFYKYDLETLIHYLCCGLLTMHRDAIETIRVMVDDKYYLDDYPRGSKTLNNNTIKILFNSNSISHSMGFYRQIKSFDWDKDYVYKKPLDESKGMLNGLFTLIPNSVTDDNNELCLPSDIMNCDLQERLGLLDGLMINSKYDNIISSLYPHIILLTESLATLLSRQSMMFEETIYAIVERITKKETSSDEGDSSEEYNVSVGIEELTKVYSICIFDMRSPKKLTEVESGSIGSLSLNNSGFNIGDSGKSETSLGGEVDIETGYSEKSGEKTIVLKVFKASRYEQATDNNPNNNYNPWSYGGNSINIGSSYTYGNSTDSEGNSERSEPPSIVNVNIKYYNYKAIDASYGTDYVVKDGKLYFKVSSVEQKSSNEYKFDFKFDSASKQYFTLQNGMIVHI